MPKIIYIAADGRTFPFVAAEGVSLMQLATSEGIDGIIGECGGALSCATCHVHVDDAWVDRLPRPKDEELLMLEFVDDLQPNSRLGCQIRVCPELDGLIVRVPG